VSCVCDWLRDATGLDFGDRYWICNAAQNASRPTSGHLTALTWTLFTTEFGLSLGPGVFRNALMSWNSVWLRCGHTSVRPSLMRPSMSGGSNFWHAS